MILILELVVEALFWVLLALLRVLFELLAEVFMRGLIWLLALVFRATGRQFTLGSRAIQLMVGVRLANARWYEEALSCLPEHSVGDDLPTDAPTRAFAMTRGWIFARQGKWDEVKGELELLVKSDGLAELQPRCLPLVAELAWAAGQHETARIVLIAAAQDDWNADKSGLFDDLQNRRTAAPDMPAPVWPDWPSKLRIKWGPITVIETRLLKATNKLRSGWRNAAKEQKRKQATAKLEKAAEHAPGSVVALMAEAELPRLRAEVGLYR